MRRFAWSPMSQSIHGSSKGSFGDGPEPARSRKFEESSALTPSIAPNASFSTPPIACEPKRKRYNPPNTANASPSRPVSLKGDLACLEDEKEPAAITADGLLFCLLDMTESERIEVARVLIDLADKDLTRLHSCIIPKQKSAFAFYQGSQQQCCSPISIRWSRSAFRTS